MISVVMPAWNAAAWIGDAIRSIQAQTCDDMVEVIVVDDGSDDDTARAAHDAWAPRRQMLLVIERTEHRGYRHAFNRALSLATGDIIARHDADDISLPTRFERQVDLLRSRKPDELIACTCDVYRQRIEPHAPLRRIENCGMDIHHYLHAPSPRAPYTPTIVAPAHVYHVVGHFPDCDSADSAWNFRAILHDVHWVHVPEPLYIYREHAGQLSQTREDREPFRAQQAEYWRMWEARFGHKDGVRPSID